MIESLRIGTRGSKLALWQAHHVQDRLAAIGIASELVIIKTQGDRITHLPFAKMEGKGFFTKELEDAQLGGRVDLAVHSLKDLGSEQPAGLITAALMGREDPRDLLLARTETVVNRHRKLPLAPRARVGTSSARRQAQIKRLAPEAVIADLRGNVPTRIRKLRDGDYDAIVIACAGVERLALDLSDLIELPLSPDDFVPAPGQGMLAIQCRDEDRLKRMLARLHSVGAARPVEAERWLLGRLEGGCQLPFGCHVRPQGDGFTLTLFLEEGERPPLTLRLTGSEPRALAEEAWREIVRYRRAG